MRNSIRERRDADDRFAHAAAAGAVAFAAIEQRAASVMRPLWKRGAATRARASSSRS